MELTAAEYRQLCLLLKNSGKVLTRGMILDRLWDGAGNFVDDNTLSVYVRRLREKLEKETMQSLERMEQLTSKTGRKTDFDKLEIFLYHLEIVFTKTRSYSKIQINLPTGR